MLMGGYGVRGRSALGLAIYSLCVIFVLSFLLFEVLDIDGSDFPKAPDQLMTESPHADVRRLGMDLAHAVIVPPIGPEVVVTVAPAPRVTEARLAPPLPVILRPLLARASLDDVPPTA